MSFEDDPVGGTEEPRDTSNDPVIEDGYYISRNGEVYTDEDIEAAAAGSGNYETAYILLDIMRMGDLKKQDNAVEVSPDPKVPEQQTESVVDAPAQPPVMGPASWTNYRKPVLPKGAIEGQIGWGEMPKVQAEPQVVQPVVPVVATPYSQFSKSVDDMLENPFNDSDDDIFDDPFEAKDEAPVETKPADPVENSDDSPFDDPFETTAEVFVEPPSNESDKEEQAEADFKLVFEFIRGHDWNFDAISVGVACSELGIKFESVSDLYSKYKEDFLED